ncbi:MAG: DUF2029 domain-containing protein [Actinobacteria bacterium]|nr:MAG: DUF2029 domain-containing protein [Actinomycetota bacterium]
MMPGRAGWLLVATAAFSLAAVVDNPIGSVACSLVGLIVTLLAVVGFEFPQIPITYVSGGLALMVLAIAGSQRMGRFSVLSGSVTLGLVISLATAGTAMLATSKRVRGLAVVAAAIAFLFGSLSVLVPNWDPDLSSDIYRAHVAAGEALTAGQNPYGDAVTFESGDPNRPDVLVEGYPYPPPALVTYAATSTFTDSRIISVVAFGLTLAGLALFARRASSIGWVSLGALVLLATTPIWRMAVFMAWTEPLSIALFGASLVGIARKRSWGWIVLGVAMASKQYLVVLAPLVLLYRDSGDRRPGWLALASAAITAGFPALLGVGDYYQAIVGNALDIGFRPDTQSLNGAIAALGGEFLIPTAAMILVVGLMIAWFARRRVSPQLLPAAGVAVVAAALLVTSGFPNYWLLVSSMAGLAALVAATGDEYGRGDGAKAARREVQVEAGADQIAEDPVPGTH